MGIKQDIFFLYHTKFTISHHMGACLLLLHLYFSFLHLTVNDFFQLSQWLQPHSELDSQAAFTACQSWFCGLVIPLILYARYILCIPTAHTHNSFLCWVGSFIFNMSQQEPIVFVLSFKLCIYPNAINVFIFMMVLLLLCSPSLC